MSAAPSSLIPFADYMDEVLYGPQGYYSSGAAKSGRSGDYFTAPDVGAVFGRLLAAIFSRWAAEFAARPFHIVECGAGEGALAASITSALAKDHAPLLPHVVYSAVERSPARRETLKRLTVPCPLEVHGGIEELAAKPVSGCILANELIDAFPVHRVRMGNGRLQEGYVERRDEGVRMIWGEPSTPALEAYFKRLDLQLPDGYETEINLAMAGWLSVASRALTSGLLVIIDYGRPAHEYYHPERTQGTLRGFRRHEVVRDVLARDVMDITADVDFTGLALAGRDAGLTPLAYMEMGSFLMQGAQYLLEGNRESATAPESGSLAFAPPPTELRHEWSGLRYLVHPEGMGSAFQVLVFGKGLNPEDWPFEGNRLKRLRLENLK